MRMERVSVFLCVLVALAFTACGTDSGDSDTVTTGTDAVTVEDGTTAQDLGTDPGLVTLSHAGKVIAHGGSYNIPDNNNPESSNMALFSQQKDLMTVTNESDAELVLNYIRIEVKPGTEEEEYSLIDGDTLTDEPLEMADHTLPAGERFDFYMKIYPVYSGERAATLTIAYTVDGEMHEYVVNVTGWGRPSDNGTKFTGAELSLHKLLGHISTDEQVTGMVADQAGNSYVLAQSKVIPGYDGFYYDLVIGKVTPDGELAWAKIYSRKSAWEWAPDPGQNDETGGSPNAIAIDDDGFVYIATSMSNANTNNNNSAHVMKLDPADGAILWDVIWRPEWTTGSFLDRMACNGYAVDVAADYVFVAGSTGDGNANGTLGSNSSIMLLGLNKADGTVLFQEAVDVAAGYNDRGYAVGAEDDGASVYVGGLTNGRGLLLKFTGTNTDAPEVAWVKKLDMGTGSNVYGMDVEGTDVYLALDRRGAATFFSFAKVNGTDGSVTWAKTYVGNNGDSNNCNVVKVAGDHVYAGGRVGISQFDAQMGDGLIVRVAKADGAFDWAGIYFTGKGPNEIAEHRIKGIAIVGEELMIAGQIYTGSVGGEMYRYDGYWYDNVSEVADFPELVAADIADFDAYTCVNGEALAVADVHEEVAYDDLPDVVSWGDAVEKKEGNGATVDEDLFWMKFQLNK